MFVTSQKERDLWVRSIQLIVFYHLRLGFICEGGVSGLQFIEELEIQSKGSRGIFSTIGTIISGQKKVDEDSTTFSTPTKNFELDKP